MAARKNAWHTDVVRRRIRASQLMRRLAKHALGKLDMTVTQIKAAEILLRKVVPDLKAVEHTGTVNHVNYDAAVIGLLNERGTQAGDAASASVTVN
jgi:hypothetical protein